MSQWMTPPQIARQRGVRVGKVLAWIKRGELEAVNMAECRSGRPRWKVSPEALAAFERGRSNRVSEPILRATGCLPSRTHAVSEFF